jgi:hypothetical protein
LLQLKDKQELATAQECTVCQEVLKKADDLLEFLPSDSYDEDIHKECERVMEQSN